MITYAETQIESDDLKLFHKIKRSIDSVDNFKTTSIISCHMLAFAIAEIFHIKAITGFWTPGFEHSWCVTKHGNIIDVYPIGTVGGPLLIDRKIGMPKTMYVPNDMVLERIKKEKKFQENVKIVKSVLINLAQK